MFYVTPQGTACTDPYRAVMLAQFQSHHVSLAPLPLVAKNSVTPPASATPALPARPAYQARNPSAKVTQGHYNQFQARVE